VLRREGGHARIAILGGGATAAPPTPTSSCSRRLVLVLVVRANPTHRRVPEMLCSAATICAQPGRCSEHMDGWQWAVITFTMFLAPLAALVLPRLHRGTANGPSPFDSGGGLCCSMVPRPCVATGFLPIIWLFVVAVLPMIFLLLSAPMPCATALGDCGTISCAAGNIYPQGYVFMCVSLTAMSFAIVREAAALPSSSLRTLLVIGGLFPTLTGVYPERFGKPLSYEAGGYVFFNGAFVLHLLGLAGSSLLVVALPFHASARRASHRGPSPARRPSAKATFVPSPSMPICQGHISVEAALESRSFSRACGPA
jgi:hypothetical membrane protein